MTPIRKIAAAALLAFLSSCGGFDPAVDAPVVTDEERAFGAEQHPLLLAEFGGEYAGGEARYVEAVGARMAEAAGLADRCTFTLINSPVVNAFAVPGCYIYITRGLFATVTSEAELASVIGHEVGHIVARHPQRRERRSIWRNLGVFAVGLTGSERLTRLAGQAAQLFGLRYSRGQEYEADDLGVRYLRQAGYDVYAAANMLAALGRHEAFMTRTGSGDAARSIPEWSLSHPLTGNRVERARETAGATGLADDALPERAEPYLTEVDGLLYGDDPEQGFVIGRQFAHPLMRIFFEAPQGFSLTNSPQAIRLSGPNGVAGEFGGGALPPGGLQAYAERLAAQVAGNTPAQITDAQGTVINGLPAIVTQLALSVRNGTVPLSIVAYDGGGGDAYHFIMVSPPANASAEALARLFGSFRRLSAAEASQLRPRVVRSVPVGPGDTPDTLARLMADDDPRALFLLLNGLGDGQQLEPGQRVKLVTVAPGG